MGLADRLKMSVSEAKTSITATEFIRWLEYYKQKWNEPDLVCYYLAQIAFEIFRLPYRIFGGHYSVTMKDFLLQFREKVVLPKPKVDESKLRRTLSGDLIGPEFQKKIDRAKAQFKAAVMMPNNELRHVPTKKAPTRRR